MSDEKDLFMKEILGPFQLDGNPNILYHYTSINSLQSIIENKQLWITHSRFMNDAGESEYFWEVLQEVLEEFTLVPMPENDMTEFLEWIKKTLINSKDTFLSIKESYDKFYLLSFSMTSNSLSMWNYYGKNDGYCIGIYPQQIWGNWKRNDGGNMISGSVIYDRDQQKKILNNELDHVFKWFLFNSEGFDDEKFNEVTDNLFMRWIFSYFSFFKHESFKIENEFRIAFWNLKLPVYYRPYQGAIAPYIKIDLANEQQLLEIESVTCGPYIKHDNVLLGLERWLDQMPLSKKLTIENGALTQSDIPIRF